MTSSQSDQSVSQEKKIFYPPKLLSQQAFIPDIDTYYEMYQHSLDDPETFWASTAQDFFWYQKWKEVLSYNWEDKIDIRWFDGGQTNLCVNAIDRHLPSKKDQVALQWVGNEPGEESKLTYSELSSQVNRCANALKKLGVKKGDRVSLYMPMILELPIAMLACARIGAVHSVVFAGFSPDSLKDRIVDAKCSILITANEGIRGNKKIPLKANCDEAMQLSQKEGQTISHCIVVKRTEAPLLLKEGRDFEWNSLMKEVSDECEPEIMDSEDPLFILYTSGSTGKPKGVLHTTAGYMIYTALTFKYVFDYKPGEIYWCTADIGWVTGHSYLVYGPLCNGATSLMFEGIPSYPKSDRFWEIIEKYKVNIFYTAPTAIRVLMGEGEKGPEGHDLSSLRILGSVGETINPKTWLWYYENIGHEKCPIVDTWWQTETGGILISPLPGAMPTKPGSASLPFFGIDPDIIKEDGTSCPFNQEGNLVIKKPWPGIMRSIYGDHKRFKETYFSQHEGVYFTGDQAKRDEDGYYWLMGRMDDVIKVSGHRIGTAEVESAFLSSKLVVEAAVVGFPHDIKGQGIYAFVVLQNPSSSRNLEEVKKELTEHVRKEIGAIASPDKIQFTQALPKTRSGKIMRRILRKIAEGKSDEIGDTSTLADPSVVDQLIDNKI